MNQKDSLAVGLKMADPALVRIRALAARLGPEFVTDLSPAQQNDRFIQRLLRKQSLPPRLQPWTVEYEVARLFSAAVLSLTGGTPLEDSWHFKSSVENLLAKGLEPTQLEKLLENVQTAAAAGVMHDTDIQTAISEATQNG